MKSLYVHSMRNAAKVAKAVGLLDLLEKSGSRKAIWARSLFSIYDSADLVYLDVPWWTFPAIDIVQEYIAKRGGRVRVFEYGSGASTVWLAKRCEDVATVEHDQGFAESMRSSFSEYPNIHMTIRPPEQPSDSNHVKSLRKGYEAFSFDSYVNSIDEVPGAFDIVVIDGRARAACLDKAKGRLAEGGIVVFDNSNRQEYRESIARSGLAENILRGLAPALPYSSQTSILSKASQ